MMRADAFSYHVDPVRMEMTGMQQIPISHTCDLDEIKSKGILSEEKLVQVCSTDKSESQIVLSSTKVLQRIANQKAFTKVSTQIKNEMLLMK